MTRIGFAITSYGDIPFRIYENHIICLIQWGKKYEIVFIPTFGTTLIEARTSCVEVARKTKCDYILYVDSDVILPLNTLDSLIACNADLASGLCKRRGFPFTDIAWIKVEGQLRQTEFDPNVLGMFPVDVVGGGIALFKMSVFDKLEKPYFRHVFENGNQTYEDVYLCNIMKSKGMSIVINTRVQVDHRCEPIYVNPKNAMMVKEFYEKSRL